MVIREVRVAREREVADRSAVGSTKYRFELVDQFHRAHLGGARQGARRKERVEGVEGIETFL